MGRPKSPDSGQILVQQVFTSESGRQLLDYLNSQYVLTTSFSSDPLKMAFLEGKRSLVLDFINDVERSK